MTDSVVPQLEAIKGNCKASNKDIDYDALVEEIWDEFDVDGSNELDKGESWRFVQKIMSKHLEGREIN